MALTYSAAVKTDRMNATRSYFVNGTLKIRDSSNNVLVTYTLNATAGSVTGSAWNLGFVATTVAAGGTGIANNAVVENSGGTVGLSGLSVGTSGSDVIIDNTNINAGQNVSVASATFNHAV